MVWGVVTPALIGSWAFWTLEWAETGVLHTVDTPMLKTFEAVAGVLDELIGLRTLRSWIARGVFSWVSLGILGWWTLPLCLDIRVSTASSTLASAPSTNAPKKTQITILGYANAYGASYLIFYLLVFSLVYLCTSLPGQVILGLFTIALMSYLEALDGVRDAKEIERVVARALNASHINTRISSSTITATKKSEVSSDTAKKDFDQDEAEVEPATFLATLPLTLLSFITFHATGHQSTVSSMQWKTSFVLTETVKYPWSVLSVLLNSAGPFLLLGIGEAALAGGWKLSPMLLPRTASDKTDNKSSRELQKLTKEEEAALGQDVEHSSLLTTLLIQLYFLILLFGASMGAAILRRHLMVWNIFAPRFMAAVVEMLIVDLGVCLSMWFVVGRVVAQVGWMLGRVGIGRTLKQVRGDGGGEKEKE